MTEDIRRLKRRQADNDIHVVDCMTRHTVGVVCNLSETGMMMIARLPITTDGLYQFELKFAAHAVSHPLHVGAHELWSALNQHTGQMEVGFRFIDISPADRAWLRMWVKEPGSQYV